MLPRVPRGRGRMRYRTVVVDPPWPVRKTGLRKVRPLQGRTLDYRCLSLEDIRSFPVQDWCADNAYLFLWTTNRFLPESFEVLRNWGFRYYTTMVWCKPSGVCPFGPLQLATEWVLLGIKGKSDFSSFPMGKMKNWFVAPVTRHSEKPKEFYRAIRDFTPEPRIDLFARRRHEGFDAWGDQVEK